MDQIDPFENYSSYILDNIKLSIIIIIIIPLLFASCSNQR